VFFEGGLRAALSLAEQVAKSTAIQDPSSHASGVSEADFVRPRHLDVDGRHQHDRRQASALPLTDPSLHRRTKRFWHHDPVSLDDHRDNPARGVFLW
jgi:hypothetical protein